MQRFARDVLDGTRTFCCRWAVLVTQEAVVDGQDHEILRAGAFSSRLGRSLAALKSAASSEHRHATFMFCNINHAKQHFVHTVVFRTLIRRRTSQLLQL